MFGCILVNLILVNYDPTVFAVFKTVTVNRVCRDATKKFAGSKGKEEAHILPPDAETLD